MIKLSEQDVIDLRSAIAEAQNELCVDLEGDRFPQATSYYRRLADLDKRLELVISIS